MLVPSRLFGPLRISSDQVIVFPDGLLGFSGTHRFVLLPAASDGVFWLHSIEEGNLAFLVVEPSHFFRDYVVDVPDHVVPFDISVASDLLVLRDEHLFYVSRDFGRDHHAVGRSQLWILITDLFFWVLLFEPVFQK